MCGLGLRLIYFTTDTILHSDVGFPASPQHTAPGATINEVSMPVNAEEEVAEGQFPAGRTEFVILGESASEYNCGYPWSAVASTVSL